MATFNRIMKRFESTYLGSFDLPAVKAVQAAISARYVREDGFRIALLGDDKHRIVRAYKKMGGFQIEFSKLDGAVEQFEVRISNYSRLQDLSRWVTVFYILGLTAIVSMAKLAGFPIPGWATIVLPSLVAMLTAMAVGTGVGYLVRMQGVWFDKFALMQILDAADRILHQRLQLTEC